MSEIHRWFHFHVYFTSLDYTSLITLSLSLHFLSANSYYPSHQEKNKTLPPFHYSTGTFTKLSYCSKHTRRLVTSLVSADLALLTFLWIHLTLIFVFTPLLISLSHSLQRNCLSISTHQTATLGQDRLSTVVLLPRFIHSYSDHFLYSFHSILIDTTKVSSSRYRVFFLSSPAVWLSVVYFHGEMSTEDLRLWVDNHLLPAMSCMARGNGKAHPFCSYQAWVLPLRWKAHTKCCFWTSDCSYRVSRRAIMSRLR